MNRRSFVAGTAAAAAVAMGASAEARSPNIKVYKSPTCGCCTAWMEHLESDGFAVEARNVDQDTLDALKARSGITPRLASCHTAFIDNFVVEGHVPASDIQRLLAERPEALGLSVPGMPIGSPGMEAGDRRDSFDTLLLLRDGTIEVFQRYG